MRRATMFGAALLASLAAVSARSDEHGTAVDLSSLSEIGSTYVADEDSADIPFTNVASGTTSSANRFYASGIVGVSFGTLQSGGFNTAGGFDNIGQASDSLFTAGGAVGMAFARPTGQLRLEVEGRGRDTLSGVTNSFEPPTPSFFYAVRATDGWSVMSNVWRDWYLTKRLGVYGGGGIGAGGYHLSVDDTVVSGDGHVGGFAWQVGGGTTYELTDRVTIDLGYRFFDTVTGALPLSLGGPGGAPAGSYLSNYYASELLVSVRIYEPFRGLRDRR